MSTLLAWVGAAVAVVLLAGAFLTWIIARRVARSHAPEGGFVPVAGGRIHVINAQPRERRPEATVVLLHGATSNASDLMRALGDRLAERCRVVAVDRPGHGWSDRIAGAGAADPARQAAAIAEALRKLDVRDAIVVAHSLAGVVAPHLALAHPDIAAGLVLVSPVTHPWPGGKITWYYALGGRPGAGWLLSRTLTTPIGAAVMARVAEGVFAPHRAPPRYVEQARIRLLLRPHVFHANAQDVAALYRAVTAQAGRYGDIRVPCTVIAGDLDRIVYTDIHARAFAATVQEAKLVVLEGVGHMPHYTHTEVVLREIDALAERIAERREPTATPLQRVPG